MDIGYKKLNGASAAYTEKGRIVMTVPFYSIARHYARVEVTRDGEHLYLFARKIGDWHGKRQGYNAWQRARPDPEVGGIHVTKIEVPTERMLITDGLAADLEPFATTRDVEVSLTPHGVAMRIRREALHPGRQVRPFTRGIHARNDEEDRNQAMTTETKTSIVQCAFPGTPNKRYAYYTNIEGLKEGDFVVVSSPYRGDSSFCASSQDTAYSQELKGFPVVVRVVSVELTVEAIDKVVKWIIQRVDTTGYAERIAREEKRAVLIAQIKRAEKAAREKLEIEKLRELSPELAGLVAELAAL